MEDIIITEILADIPANVVEFFKKRASGQDYKTFLEQYDPRKHTVHDKRHRPSKLVKTEQGMTEKDVARLSLPFQRIIVDRAAAFLIGEGIELKATIDSDDQQIIYDALQDVWHDNKLDYSTRQMVRIWMSETEVAEYWYIQEKDGELRLRMQIWAHSMGDDLLPYFNECGDLEAFARCYKIGRIEYMDVWSADEIIKYEKETAWEEVSRQENVIGKIPVIYYQRERPEWSDVQDMIERFETMISNFADTNDYFASPIVKIRGRVLGFADKGESGKMITMDENADAEYLTWSQAPDAIRLEKETLQELIFSMTQTPDISFENMKGVGNLSGIALRLMFLDAKLKSLKHHEGFGEGIQRRINLIMAALRVINITSADIRVVPEFVFYMPQNDKEIIDMLVTSTGGRAIMSRRTAIQNNPFVLDAEKENEDIEADDAGSFGNIMP